MDCEDYLSGPIIVADCAPCTAGMASQAVLARLTRIGQGYLTVPSGLAALQAILHDMRSISPALPSASVLAVNPFNWQTYTRSMQLDPLPHFFAQVTPANTQADSLYSDTALLSRAASITAAHKQQITAAGVLTMEAIAGQIQAALQGILGEGTGPDDPLMSAGLDSLGSVELANVLARRFSLQLPSTLIFDYPTVKAIAAYLHGRLQTLTPTALASSESAASATVTAGLPHAVISKPLQQGKQGRSSQAVAILSAAHQPMASSQRSPGSPNGIAWGWDHVMQVPAVRWDTEAASGHQQHSMQARFGGFMQSVDLFDATAFGLSASEASSMDPQHRCLLQCSAEALHSARQQDAGVEFGKSGVFVGVSWTEYAKLGLSHGMPVGAYTAQSAVLSVAAGEPSHS